VASVKAQLDQFLPHDFRGQLLESKRASGEARYKKQVRPGLHTRSQSRKCTYTHMYLTCSSHAIESPPVTARRPCSPCGRTATPPLAPWWRALVRLALALSPSLLEARVSHAAPASRRTAKELELLVRLLQRLAARRTVQRLLPRLHGLPYGRRPACRPAVATLVDVEEAVRMSAAEPRRNTVRVHPSRAGQPPASRRPRCGCLGGNPH
jgi:hypothetical protein